MSCCGCTKVGGCFCCLTTTAVVIAGLVGTNQAASCDYAGGYGAVVSANPLCNAKIVEGRTNILAVYPYVCNTYSSNNGTGTPVPQTNTKTQNASDAPQTILDEFVVEVGGKSNGVPSRRTSPHVDPQTNTKTQNATECPKDKATAAAESNANETWMFGGILTGVSACLMTPISCCLNTMYNRCRGSNSNNTQPNYIPLAGQPAP